MAHKSGCRIDRLKYGGYDITYFGKFQTSEQSQSLHVRNLIDLEDLYYKIQKEIKDAKYNRKE